MKKTLSIAIALLISGTTFAETVDPATASQMLAQQGILTSEEQKAI